MGITGKGTETYLYINELAVKRPISLSDGVELLPAKSIPDFRDIVAAAKREIDIGVSAIFARRVASQIRVTAGDPKSVAERAWNAQWDVVLLGAFFECNAACNLQCDVPVESFNSECDLNVTNYQLHGLGFDRPRTITEREACWIEQNMEVARSLLHNDSFNNAVHALWSYRWHSLLRAQLAILWSGIESLFSVDSEIVFRTSLLIAKFLYPKNKAKQREVFSETKKLYGFRSRAVHGGKMKSGSEVAVEQSIQLLLRLVMKCVENQRVPDTDGLLP